MTPYSRALVTGGAGFVGSALVDVLRAQGVAVTVLDLMAPRRAQPDVHYLKGSITNPAMLDRACAGVDVLFHLAAIPQLWAKDPDQFLAVNVGGTEQVLAAAERHGVRRVIHTSTESVLGGGGRQPDGLIDETARPTLAAMPGAYCRSKWLAEQAALDAAARGLPVTVVNPTVPVGPGDYWRTPPTVMLCDFLSGRNGAYLEFGLNVVDVRDVAHGHWLAACHGELGERYILGGENLAMSELLALLGELSGQPMPRRQVPYGLALAFAHASEWLANHVTGKAPRAPVTGLKLARSELVFSTAKAREALGYEPRPVREALTAAVAWLRDVGFIA